MFDALSIWLKRLRTARPESHDVRPPLPPVSYPKLSMVFQPPRNQEIATGSVTVVVSPSRQPKWAMFLCPCGCQSVITLSLQPTKRPHWRFETTKGDRPTLQPSVWRDVGCMSHFFLEDGRIYWCSDTGSSPDKVRRHRNLSRAGSNAG
jgi:hypothetical protein